MSDTLVTSETYKTKKRDVFEGTAPEVKERTKKMLMYLIIFAIIMMFGGWVSAYIVMQPQSYWVHPTAVPSLTLSNVLLVLSSITLVLAGVYAKKENKQLTTVFLGATFLLGIGFTLSQYQAYSEFNEKGFYWTFNKIGGITGEYGTDYIITKNSVPLVYENGQFYHPTDKERIDPLTKEIERQQDNSTSLTVLFMAIHVLHLGLGLIYLLVNIYRSITGRFLNGNTLSLKTQGIYWHFMGILWLILYAFLFIIY